jgi:hypothetical protein
LCKRKIPCPKDEDAEDDEQSKESVDLHFANPVRTRRTHAQDSISTPASPIACKHTHKNTHKNKNPI